MQALGQEAFEPFFRFRRGVGARDADDVEATGTRFFDEGCFDVGGIAQKSRSA
jgi:hypothetical protein